MKNSRVLRTLAAIGLSLAVLAPFGDLDAAPKGGKGAKKPAATTPATVETKITLKPKGLSFGLSPGGVTKVYNRAIDADFKPRWKEVEPGVQMDRLRDEIDMAKQDFRLSYQEFDGKPTSLDATPMRSEYTHENDEAFMKSTRDGKERYLFFIGKKLWKVLDVYPLGEGAKWGLNFKEAVAKLKTRMGDVQGRALAADPDKGRPANEVDYTDGKIHMRAIELGEKELGVAYVDMETEGRIASMRKAKREKREDVSASVKSVLRSPSSDAPVPKPKQ